MAVYGLVSWPGDPAPTLLALVVVDSEDVLVQGVEGSDRSEDVVAEIEATIPPPDRTDERERLRSLIGGLSTYMVVQGPIEFEGSAQESFEPLVRLYFGA